MFLDGKEEFELWRELFFGVETIREVNTSDSAISVNSHSKCLYVIAAICSSSEIRQIELDLIPSFIEPHRHGTNERFNAGSRLIVRSSKSSANVLIV